MVYPSQSAQHDVRVRVQPGGQLPAQPGDTQQVAPWHGHLQLNVVQSTINIEGKIYFIFINSINSRILSPSPVPLMTLHTQYETPKHPILSLNNNKRECYKSLNILM